MRNKNDRCGEVMHNNYNSRFKIIKYNNSLADRYKDKIPKSLYNGIYKYIVEITD